jgi:hypothetical protein
MLPLLLLLLHHHLHVITNPCFKGIHPKRFTQKHLLHGKTSEHVHLLLAVQAVDAVRQVGRLRRVHIAPMMAAAATCACVCMLAKVAVTAAATMGEWHVRDVIMYVTSRIGCVLVPMDDVMMCSCCCCC